MQFYAGCQLCFPVQHNKMYVLSKWLKTFFHGFSVYLAHLYGQCSVEVFIVMARTGLCYLKGLITYLIKEKADLTGSAFLLTW